MRGQEDSAREGGRKQTAEAAGDVRGERKEENWQNDGGGMLGLQELGFAWQHRARRLPGLWGHCLWGLWPAESNELCRMCRDFLLCPHFL